MSVLDTFYFMFEADTTQVEKGLNSGDKAAKTLEKSLNQSDEAAAKLSNSFVDMAKGIGAVLTAALSLGALKAMAAASAESTNALADNARELRQDANELQAWQNAIIASNGTAEGFNGTLRNLMQRTRDPIGALKQIADRFKGLNDLQADRLGERLGLDKGTVEAMRGGRDGLQALIDRQKMLSTVTKEQIAVARAFKDQTQDTNLVLDDMRRRVATEILPAMTLWLKRLETLVIWMREKKPFVLGFFGAVATIITVAYLPAMARAVVATYALLAPYLAIIAVVTAVGAAFALVYDDVQNFLDGNESVIGELSKKWPVIGQIVHALIGSFKALFDLTTAGFKYWAEVISLGPVAAMENLKQRTGAIIDGLIAKYPLLATAFKAVGDSIGYIVDHIGDTWQALWDLISGIIGKIISAASTVKTAITGAAGFFGLGAAPATPGGPATAPVVTVGPRAPGAIIAPETVKAVEAGKQQVAATKSPVAAMTSTAISNSTRNASKTTTVKIDKLEVNTQATDAKGIADGVSQSLQDSIKSANDEFDDGVQI